MMNHPEHDPLDTLLAPPPAKPDDSLRRLSWEHSTRLLWRRRFVRRGAYVATLAACFLAGLLTTFLRAPAVVERERIVYVDRPAPQVPSPVEKPAELEQKARANATARADLLRRAGDLYANEQHDLEGALRCYSQSLDSAGDTQPVISTDDHWLLMAIKDARMKEKNNAKNPE